MTYAQQGEDAIILENVPERGRFLDIGAFHPTELSNTRALYERGWSGVMVEPSPGPMRTLLAEYGDNERIILLSAAVAAERGTFPLRVADTAYTTGDEQTFEKWREEGEFLGRLFIPHVTIEDLINQFGPFQFVNIDAEGKSLEILARLLATALHPECICCEHDSHIVRAANMGEARGYKTVHVNDCNIILAR